MWRRCPGCPASVWISEFAETVICRACGAWFHPEQSRPVESPPAASRDKEQS